MRDGLANMNVSPKGKKAKMAPYQGLFFFGSSNFSLPASSNEKILCTLCLRRLDTLKCLFLVYRHSLISVVSISVIFHLTGFMILSNFPPL